MHNLQNTTLDAMHCTLMQQKNEARQNELEEGGIAGGGDEIDGVLDGGEGREWVGGCEIVGPDFEVHLGEVKERVWGHLDAAM